MTTLAANAVPVIPGAHGFGMDTAAGRGGTVYRVTNLNTSGAGSLQACVGASGPRVCVFEVSGVINMTQDLMVWNPNLTIAGQTAPSPGIMLRGGAIWVAASDVLVQHLVIRAGDSATGPDPGNRGALKISSNGSIRNVVIDHCTLSWGLDETVDIWNGWDNITLSNSIISEGLNYSVLKDWSGYGAIIGSASGASISLIGNLFIHNQERNPLTNSAAFVFVNNVVYNAGSMGLNQSGEFGLTKSSIIGNAFIRGPSSGKPYWNGDIGIHGTAVDGSDVYLADNAFMSNYAAPQVAASNQWASVFYFSGKTQANFKVDSPPVSVPGLVPLPIAQVRDSVLANAGSRPADRNAKDQEMVNDVKNGTGNIVNCVSSSNCRAAPYNNNAGGWPTYAQNSRPLTLPANPNSDPDGNGYTNLEEWLQGMAAEVEGQAVRPEPPSGLTVQ